MNLTKFRIIWFLLLPVEIFMALPSFGQIVPDRTVGTTVTPNVEINGVPSDRIDGGTIGGSNLFHSFQEFNIESGRGAYFTNPEGITNIFSRITGTNPSHINGILGVLGNANLFFLNPNGIVFGAGARLDLKGSFVGTTANRILFDKGFAFSANNDQAPSPLLSISVPIGLQFGSNTGAIAVQGTGHNAQLSNNTTPVSGLNIGSAGLQVQPGRTLALVGGNLALDGGLLSASGGRIELGSVAGGSADLNSIPEGFALSYPHAFTFGNIQMTQRALVSAGGTSSGSIQIQGRQVNIRDSSMVLVQNQGNQTAGDITLTATDSLQLSGSSSNPPSSSSLIEETVAAGAAGNITISTSRMTIENRARVLNRTFSDAPSGDIRVNASDELSLQNSAQPTPASNLLTITNSTGKGGNLFIATQNLSILDGSGVGARAYGAGNSGNVAVRADTIRIISPNPPPNAILGPIYPPSVLSTSTFGFGNVGDLQIDTGTLSIQNGGIVSSSSLNRGNAGNLIVNASQSIEVNGRASAEDPSYIGAIARNFLGNNQNSTANAGSISINTPVLSISNGATVFVENQVLGNAGNLTINANTLQLYNRANISASTKVGEGGNIDLQILNRLQMRQGSFISAEAGGSGNGGNITLDAATIVNLENSNITANAVQGQGGNIQIATQGIFRSFDSNITASSQLGVSGIVDISTPNLEQHQVLVTSATNFLNEDQAIASSCLTRRNSQQARFVVTGNGGLPETPDRLLIPYEAAQVRNVGQLQGRRNQTPETTNSGQPNSQIQEATGLAFTPDGKVALVVTVAKGEIASPTDLTCSN